MPRTALLIAAALLPSFALAQPGGFGGPPPAAQELEPNDEIMANNDRNDDGKITSEEARASRTWLASAFYVVDINRNGQVVPEELDTLRAAMAEAARGGGRGGRGGRGFGGGGRGGPPGGGPGGGGRGGRGQ